MSALFSPINIGNVGIPNRFVNSATHECMAMATGEVSDELIKRYERLAKAAWDWPLPGSCSFILQGAVINTKPEYIMTV
jgi:hypothetical protein